MIALCQLTDRCSAGWPALHTLNPYGKGPGTRLSLKLCPCAHNKKNIKNKPFARACGVRACMRACERSCGRACGRAVAQAVVRMCATTTAAKKRTKRCENGAKRCENDAKRCENGRKRSENHIFYAKRSFLRNFLPRCLCHPSLDVPKSIGGGGYAHLPINIKW